MRRAEVWPVAFDPTLGSEIRKTQAAVIFSNDAANRNLARVVVPLTSNTERVYPGEALVMLNGTPSKAMADQIMAADKRRLESRIGELSKPDMLALEDAIRVQLGMPR